MSTLSIAKRGVIQLTSSDTSPKDITLVDPIRVETAILDYSFKDRRKDLFVQQGTISITNGDAGPTKDSAALGTAVDTAASYVLATIREKRTDAYRGASVKLQSSTLVRATFNQPAAGDTIDIDFAVVEAKSRRGVLLRIKDEETLEASWDGTLAAGETIDIAYNLVDFDDVINAILELDFKALRTLGYLGENEVIDLVDREASPGNMIQYRIRLFDSKVNAENATADIVEGSNFETGEYSRVLRTVSIDVAKNDRDFMLRVLTKLADTPGLE